MQESRNFYLLDVYGNCDGNRDEEIQVGHTDSDLISLIIIENKFVKSRPSNVQIF